MNQEDGSLCSALFTNGQSPPYLFQTHIDKHGSFIG